MCGREMSDLISYRHRQETETAATNDPSRVPAQGEELGRFVEVALGVHCRRNPQDGKGKGETETVTGCVTPVDSRPGQDPRKENGPFYRTAAFAKPDL
jgi:hypothetical protein